MDGKTMIEARLETVRGVPSAGAPASFEALLGQVRGRVDARLAAWLPSRVAASARISGDVGAVAEAIAELSLRGGKRVRAALVAAGFAAREPSFSASSASVLGICEPAMVAVELLQTYLLIHDDWMDDDDVRRGGPAVHVVLRRRFGTKALGDAGAVLAGDLASGFAQEALLETDAAPERVVRAARVFAKIQSDVVRGQIAEMGLASSAGDAGRGARPKVETVHALKTATYTVTGPLLLGAALAGADDAYAALLERFGRPLGVAFQLRDDVLGVFGDPSATGKPIGNDIRQGKRTALVAELRGPALALAEKVLGRPTATDAEVAELVRAMEETGARARVEARIRELSEEARTALAALDASALASAWLSGAITALGERVA
jgi:geranylgeranyl diphosphate synthase type I